MKKHINTINYVIANISNDHDKYFEFFAKNGVDFNNEEIWSNAFGRLIRCAENIDTNSWIKAFEFLVSCTPYLQTNILIVCLFRIVINSPSRALKIVLEHYPDLDVNVTMRNGDIPIIFGEMHFSMYDDEYMVSLIELLMMHIYVADVDHIFDLMFKHGASITDEKVMAILMEESANEHSHDRLKPIIEYFKKRGLDVATDI